MGEDLALEVEGKVASSWRGAIAQCAYTRRPKARFAQRDARVMIETSYGTRIERYVVRSETVETVALRAEPDILGEGFRVGTPKEYVMLGVTWEEQGLVDKSLIITCVRGGGMRPLHGERARDILMKWGVPESQAKKRVDELADVLTPATVTKAVVGTSEAEAWKALLDAADRQGWVGREAWQVLLWWCRNPGGCPAEVLKAVAETASAWCTVANPEAVPVEAAKAVAEATSKWWTAGPAEAPAEAGQP